jgi:hypothetical protein
MKERYQKKQKTVPYKPGLMQTLAPIMDEVATPEQILEGETFPEEDQYQHWLAFAEQGMSLAFGGLLQRPLQYKPLRDLQEAMLLFPKHDTAQQMFLLILRQLNENPLTERLCFNKYASKEFCKAVGDQLRELRILSDTLFYQDNPTAGKTVRKYPNINKP